MAPNRSFYKWFSIGSLAVMLVVFTHCGNPSAQKGGLMWTGGGVSLSMTGNTAADSLAAFTQTVYPITRARCINCHGGSQQPLHASSNTTTAHNSIVNSFKVNFSNVPSSRMVQKLIEGHNCWGNCTANAMEMQLAVQDWKDLLATTNTTGGTSGGGGGQAYNLTTASSGTIQAERTAVGSADIVTLRYNLQPLGITNAQLEVTLQDYDTYSYLVTNVKIVSLTYNVRVKGLYLITNGVFNPQNANLTQVDEVVPAGAGGQVLSPGSMIILKDLGPAQDRISFGFETIESN